MTMERMYKQNWLLIILVITLSVVTGASAQISFETDEIEDIARKYTGNAINWPVVLELAHHDVNANKLTLSADKQQMLNNFGKTSQKYDQLKSDIKRSLEEGAVLFAKKPLADAQKLIDEYFKTVKDGNITEAALLVKKLENKQVLLDSTLIANRKSFVEAELLQKEGSVDKRKGILGSWKMAYIGDFFERQDGVKTLEKSYATLGFIDGSQVMIQPQTVAVIRKSRIDNLTQTVDTEIELTDGGVLAKLSAIGKESGDYELQAG